MESLCLPSVSSSVSGNFSLLAPTSRLQPPPPKLPLTISWPHYTNQLPGHIQLPCHTPVTNHPHFLSKYNPPLPYIPPHLPCLIPPHIPSPHTTPFSLRIAFCDLSLSMREIIERQDSLQRANHAKATPLPPYSRKCRSTRWHPRHCLWRMGAASWERGWGEMRLLSPLRTFLLRFLPGLSMKRSQSIMFSLCLILTKMFMHPWSRYFQCFSSDFLVLTDVIPGFIYFSFGLINSPRTCSSAMRIFYESGTKSNLTLKVNHPDCLFSVKTKTFFVAAGLENRKLTMS